MSEQDALSRVDFDDPKVIAAIRESADKPLSAEQLKRLAQFETRCTTGLLEFVD